MILSFIGITTFGINFANAQSCCGNKKKASCSKTESSTVQTTTVQNTASVTEIKDSIKVGGACGMCKSRIEKTTKEIEGISGAQWNETTHMLVYTYTGTVKKEVVSNAILAVGHDTELGKAQDEVYNKLPGCCKYRE